MALGEGHCVQSRLGLSALSSAELCREDSHGMQKWGCAQELSAQTLHGEGGLQCREENQDIILELISGGLGGK